MSEVRAEDLLADEGVAARALREVFVLLGPRDAAEDRRAGGPPFPGWWFGRHSQKWHPPIPGYGSDESLDTSEPLIECLPLEE